MAKKEKKAKVKKGQGGRAKKAKKRQQGDGVNFKELLANHFEKGLLGLALLVTLLIVWRGFSARRELSPTKRLWRLRTRWRKLKRS